jgi:hypothetical protein
VRHTKRRRNSGTAISEFGPALFVFLICMFFPLINLLAIATIYSIGAEMNDEQLRESAVSKRSQAQSPQGSVMYTIPTNWKASGFGKYAKIDSDVDTNVTYKDGPQDEYGNTQKFVRVSTTFSAKPFLTMAMPVAVPGLSADMKFTFSSSRLLEYAPNYNL